MRTPNPRDEVRFLADLPRGCAEGRAPALQAGSPGAVPGDSTNLAVVAPRWSNRSVRDRARFDSVRRLRVDVALRCPSPVQRRARLPLIASADSRRRAKRVKAPEGRRRRCAEAAAAGGALKLPTRTIYESLTSFHWKHLTLSHTCVVGTLGSNRLAIRPHVYGEGRLPSTNPRPKTTKAARFPGRLPWISLWFCRPSAYQSPAW